MNNTLNDILKESIDFCKTILKASDVSAYHLDLEKIFPNCFEFLRKCKRIELGTQTNNYPIRLTWHKTNHSTLGINHCITPNGIEFCYLMIKHNSSGSYETILIVDKTKVFRLSLEMHRAYKHSQNKEIIAPILEDVLYKDVMDNTIDFLCLIRKHKHLKIKGKRGLILTGKPGNGKTMLVRYLIELAKKHRFSVQSYSAANLQTGFQNNTLNNMFTSANIIVFDDVDVGCFNRSINGPLCCGILSAMDGINIISDTTAIVRIFTTNESLKSMDPAFCRPGRIDKVLNFDPPNHDLRRRFIDTWQQKEILDKISSEELVDKSEGLSFAQLDEVRNDLLLQSIRTNQMDVTKALNGLYNMESNTKKIGFT